MNPRHRSILRCLIDAQEGVCAYCPHPMARMRTVRDQANPMRPTIDHVWPVSEPFAMDAPGNYLAVHARCNGAKGNCPPTDADLATLERVNAILGWPTPQPPQNPLGMTSAEEALAILATLRAA